MPNFKNTNPVAIQEAPNNTIPDDIANLLQGVGVIDKEAQKKVYDYFYVLGKIIYKIIQYEKEKDF